MELRIVNNLGLFGWIRDGVKQSVLMGVSDAIETIGTPEASNGQLHPALLSFSNQSQRTLEATSSSSSEPAAAVRSVGAATNPGRKRLGRSLKDIEPTKSVSQ
jgi:hypothetical protein